ncbi:MaoC/PaaZ C-terminal domain-containing protein [Oleispirillum naphthae]|uniref:MaoC/PaaZ C-terminal domain-containing protein n=1 Tax=Oleispirillum naphthae TaxID=2838853 RepID=UPI003082447A
MFLTLNDIREGMEATASVCLDDEAVNRFIGLTGDEAPIHVDAQAAMAMGLPGRVVHGLLAAAPLSRILGMQLPGPRTVIQSLRLDYRKPVPVGSTVLYRVTVKRVVSAVKTVILEVRAEIGGEVAIDGTAQCTFPAGDDD